MFALGFKQMGKRRSGLTKLLWKTAAGKSKMAISKLHITHSWDPGLDIDVSLSLLISMGMCPE